MQSNPNGLAWLKLPSRITDLLESVSIEASGVYLELSAFSAKKDTQGRVSWDDLHVAVRRKVTYARATKIVGEMAVHDIVHLDDDGIDLGDIWREENPRGEIFQDPVQRERWARDKRLKRDSELCRRIKKRDRNLCRYCGVRVNWNDKVSPVGGTYDHVDPDGENDFGNVAVACRRCNGRKKDRTPEQWIADEASLQGMTLPLKPGTTAEQFARLLAEAQAREGPPGANPRSAPGQPDRAPRARDRTGSTRGQPEPNRHRTDPARPGAADPSAVTVENLPGEGEP
jgi:hypothetical protein